MIRMTEKEIEILTSLANGVIPADEKNRGAAEVNAGSVIAARVDIGVNANLYAQGMEAANLVAQERFGSLLPRLNDEEVYEVIMELKSRIPGFYKQLRADVSAVYLSDPNIWKQIGFPGPSTEQGGYPDFDQPQTLFKGGG
jgi:hypothetical protein